MAHAAGPRILIVEDNPVDGHILKLFIQRNLPSQITMVSDGLEGLNHALEHPPDVLILDLSLPSLRGEDICRVLRSFPEHRSLPIMVISGLPDSKRREMELLGFGANLYLGKPLSEKEVTRSINQLLGRVSAPTTDVPTTRDPHPPPADNTPRIKVTQDQETPDFQGYEILEIIGSGGMGTVYKAEQKMLKRIVALKVILNVEGENSDQFRRFQREAVLMARMTHPNIVGIYEANASQMTNYIAMELMSEGSLEDAVRTHRLRGEQMPNIFRQCCDALEYLHGMGVIHNDLKPANILINEHKVTKLSDFGISRYLYSSIDSESGRWFRGAGTPGYISPEVSSGSTGTAQSDQYSLARTFVRIYELPRRSAGGARPISLAEKRPDLPKGLCDALEKAQKWDPANRFPSIREFRDEVLAHMSALL